ncbi:hypothetical protein AB0O07_03370 [Streptomyces sp. NPDC093085]
MKDLPEELRGPRVFGMLQRPEGQRVPAAAVEEIARSLRGRLRA